MLSLVSSLSWCPAYHDIRTLTTSQLKNIIIDNSDICVWKTHFSNWDNLLRIIICPDVIRVMVPELSSVVSSVEDLSRDCFYKIHTKRLLLMKQQEKWLPVETPLMYIRLQITVFTHMPWAKIQYRGVRVHFVTF